MPLFYILFIDIFTDVTTHLIYLKDHAETNAIYI